MITSLDDLCKISLSRWAVLLIPLAFFSLVFWRAVEGQRVAWFIYLLVVGGAVYLWNQQNKDAK